MTAAGRTLAIGDVHGCDNALATLLGLVAPTSADTLIFLGDLVDRGPKTKQVVECVIDLQRMFHVRVLMGNHEEMMRDAICGRLMMDMWLQSGGRETLNSYGGSVDNIPPDHMRFLLACENFWETDSEIFVHANLENSVSLLNQNTEWLRWKQVAGSERPHTSGKRIVCGHTSQQDGYPLIFDGWACIDTFVYGGKYLSCLDVDADRIYQASEDGATREFALSEMR